MHTESGRVGRPRSEQARAAVLHAVDDLLVEVGYAEMTMKGIAERAGVGRQTVYRWWSTKAEILFEACRYDARHELSVCATGEGARDLRAYLRALATFLTRSEAGAGWRALLGEAQHDRAVAALVRSHDVIAESARLVVTGVAPDATPRSIDRAVALLVGPLCFAVLSGQAAVPVSSLIDDSVRAVCTHLDLG